MKWVSFVLTPHRVQSIWPISWLSLFGRCLTNPFSQAFCTVSPWPPEVSLIDCLAWPGCGGVTVALQRSISELLAVAIREEGFSVERAGIVANVLQRVSTISHHVGAEINQQELLKHKHSSTGTSCFWTCSPTSLSTKHTNCMCTDRQTIFDLFQKNKWTHSGEPKDTKGANIVLFDETSALSGSAYRENPVFFTIQTSKRMNRLK